jgi:molybdenum-dependent DNA-binding transcriptional regulator ModE
MDAQLASWASVKQLEVLEAVESAGSIRGAAKLLKLDPKTVRHHLDKLRARAAQQSAAQHQDVNRVPDGFAITGTSTLTKTSDGLQWVKTAADKKRQEEMLREFADTLAQGVAGLAPIVKPPKHSIDDLMCVYPVGDPHFGMYAWAAEAGADFDLGIAERLAKEAVDRLVLSAPNAATALLLNVGDLFHADNQSNQTRSGNQLDVDGRRPKVQQVALMTMVYTIQRLLEKHPRVYVRNNKGNHDWETSYALALMLSCWFRDEPRVTIDLSPAVCWYMQFGKVLMGSTHGDTIKGKDMLAVMAADKPVEWGQTTHRYWYVGHIHHKDIKEYPGGIVEYLRTLAPRDAWHQGQGYRAGRDMQCIVHHREHGEIERHRVDVGMLG